VPPRLCQILLSLSPKDLRRNCMEQRRLHVLIASLNQSSHKTSLMVFRLLKAVMVRFSRSKLLAQPSFHGRFFQLLIFSRLCQVSFLRTMQHSVVLALLTFGLPTPPTTYPPRRTPMALFLRSTHQRLMPHNTYRMIMLTIPPNAVNNRYSRELSDSDNRCEEPNIYQQTFSASQADTPVYGARTWRSLLHG